MAEWRTIIGTVQYEPETRDVNGKDTLRVVLKSAGTKEQSQNVSLTLWPSHKEWFTKISEGDVLVVEGKYDVRDGKTKDGESRRFHNLSVSKIASLGALDGGVRDDDPDDGDSGEDGDW